MPDVDPTAREAERARIRSAHLRPAGERAPSTARGLHHTALISSDVERTVRFYREAFEAQITFEMDKRDDHPRMVILDLGGLTIFIEQATDDVHPAATTPCLGIEHIGLAVDDIEAAVADLKGRGVVFRTDIIARGPDLRITFLDAPDGAVIELLERR